MTKSFSDAPPSYDAVTGQASSSSRSYSLVNKGAEHPTDSKARPDVDQQKASPLPVSAGPGPSPQAPYNGASVYHYTNPRTGERVVSLLPPDHPQMICLQEGQHRTQTKYGVLGILAAVLWFPLGIGFCLLDRRVRCTRCGQTLNNGMCG